jgi:predicted transcriptional regulator
LILIYNQLLDALWAHYAEHQRPAAIKAIAERTHRRTHTVIDAVQDLVAAGLAQRLGRQGKQGVVPLLDK